MYNELDMIKKDGFFCKLAKLRMFAGILAVMPRFVILEQ